MDLKSLIHKSIETNKPVKVSPKLTLIAQEKNNQVNVRLNLNGSLMEERVLVVLRYLNQN